MVKIIAEIGINHNGDMNICKKMMLLAKFSGVDYIKIQITDKRINQGDSQIKVMGKLLDFATDIEIEKYYGFPIGKTDTIENNTDGKITESNIGKETIESNISNFII